VEVVEVATGESVRLKKVNGSLIWNIVARRKAVCYTVCNDYIYLWNFIEVITKAVHTAKKRMKQNLTGRVGHRRTCKVQKRQNTIFHHQNS